MGITSATQTPTENAVDRVDTPCAPGESSIEVNANKDTSWDKKELTRSDIKKIHLQLRHASATALMSYIRAARMWTDDMEPVVKGVIE